MERARTADPHRCASCGARFEVSFFDDLDRSSPVINEVACPSCGKPKSVPVPRGAAKGLRVERMEGDEEDEGGEG